MRTVLNFKLRIRVLTLNVRLRLAVNDLVSVLLKGRPLSQLGGTRRMLYFIFVHVVFYSLEVHCELGVVWQCLVLGVVFVQVEIVVVRYVRIRLDRGDIASRSQLTAVVETIELRVRESCIVNAAAAVGTHLMRQSLIQRSLALETTLELSYSRVYRRHLSLPLCQGLPLLGYHLVLLFVHFVAILCTNWGNTNSHFAS